MKKIAFVFPGQGSQSVGMVAELAREFPLVEKVFAQASEVLDYDLFQLVQTGPEEILNQTERTQPALLAASIALWQIWQEKNGKQPVILAGHSLGEYSALVAAKALDFKAAIKLVADRGRFMQEAVPPGQGAMAAIVGLDEAKVLEICKAAKQNEIVAPANFNAIGQIVIAGNTPAVARAIELAKEAGAKIAKLLPVSVPSHCELMRPAATKLAASLLQVALQSPQIPVIQNADVTSYTSVEKIREALIKQLYQPVRWVETIQLFANQDVEIAVECGPGKVLAGLNKRITDRFPTLNINTLAQLQETLLATEGNIKCH